MRAMFPRLVCKLFGHYRPDEKLVSAYIDEAQYLHWSTCWPCKRCGFGDVAATGAPAKNAPIW